MNMRKIYYIGLIAVAMAVVACGSGDSFISRNKNNRIVASVDDNELLLKDIVADMPKGLTGADSVTFAKMYIDNWILNNLKLRRAEEVLSTKDNIDRLVEGYRQSLIMRQLDQYYVDQELDTEITEEQIKSHYRLHSHQFILDHNKVRGIVVRIPEEFRNTSALRDALSKVHKEGTQEINAFAEKHDLQVSDLTGEWVTFSDFLSYLPTVRTRNYDNLLSEGKVQNMHADDVVFYFTITKVVRKGNIAPLESVTEDIRRMIYAERRSEIIKHYEDKLRYDAMNEERIEIDSEEMMDALSFRPNINDTSVVVDEATDEIKEDSTNK